MLRSLAALVLFAAGTFSPVASSAISATLPWSGLVREGAPLELQFSLTGQEALPATLNITQGTLRWRIPLNNRDTVTFIFPGKGIPGVDTAPLQLALESYPERKLMPLQPRWLTGRQRLVVSNHAVDFTLPDDVHLLTTDTAGFAQSTPGYGSVAALIVDARVPASLSEAARRAFNNYLLACGRVVTRGPRPDLRRVAGCNGKYLREASDTSLQSALASLLNSRHTTMPANSELGRLLETPAALLTIRMWLGIAALIALGAIAARRSRKPFAWTVVTMSLITGGTVWLLQGTPHTRQITWAEAPIGGITAVPHRHLLQYRSGARARQHQSIEHKATLLSAPQARSAAHLDVDVAPSATTFAWRDTAAASTQFTWQTLADVPRMAITPGKTDDAAPVVTHLDGPPSAPGILLWQGRYLSVPALHAGEHATARAAAQAAAPPPTSLATDPMLTLFKQRTARDAYALLIVSHPTPTHTHAVVLRP